MATQADLVGRVVQVIGAVVDIEFERHLPEIYNAVRIVSDAGATTPIDVVGVADVAEGVVDRRKMPAFELDVDDRTDHLNDSTNCLICCCCHL